MERVIPEVGHVFYRCRVIDEDAGTFVTCWQQVASGSQVGFVTLDLKPVELPRRHEVQPLDAAPHFLPGVERDPDPADTKAIRAARQAEIDAATALANAAGETAGTVVLSSPDQPTA